jgi:hypothetical protein
MRLILSYEASRAVPYFSILFYEQHDFRGLWGGGGGAEILNIKNVF